ncbi:MAG: alanine--glyoxylate aminotransferase family protein [Myxococcales bacterium]|nr:alanine--glyoxylate aminotransferase family protein [Myxococcales bacterium]
MLHKAILLAARGAHAGPPSRLDDGRLVASRLCATLDEQGIGEIVVIDDDPAGALRKEITAGPPLGARVRWVRGVRADALALARPHVDGPTLLLEAEALVASEIVADLMSSAEPLLAVDGAIDRLFDPAGTPLVRIERDRVVGYCRDAESHNGCSAALVGAGIITPAVLERVLARSGSASLESLYTCGALFARDVDGARWVRIGDEPSRRYAAWLLRTYGEDLARGELPRSASRASSSRTSSSDGVSAITAAPALPSRTLSYIEGLLAEKSPQHNVLLNPGPVLTSARVKAALVHHDVCHRDDDYARVARRVQRKLRRVCGGGRDHEVMLVSGSGTAAIETTLASSVGPASSDAPNLLVISNGAFGERFAEIAELHALSFRHLRYRWGEPVRPADVAQMIDETPSIAQVIMCHHETSVGLLNPVNEVGAVCRERDVLLFVDAVSSLGAESIDVQRDNIDVLISSANKCLHAISGVSFLCVSPRVWPRIADVSPRVYYLDLKRYRERGIPFTPAVSSFFALDAALDELLREGVERRAARYRTRARRIRGALEALGLRRLEVASPSHTITTIEVPSYISFAELYAELKAAGYVIYGCKEELADRFFQIANMGELSPEMIDGFLAKLAHVLHAARRRADRRALVAV